MDGTRLLLLFSTASAFLLRGGNTIIREGGVRLSGGPNNRSGRLEVYRRRRWGTVCSLNFDDTDALVVCRSLGYSNGYARLNAHFGEGSGSIWLVNVDCSGSEAGLHECYYNIHSTRSRRNRCHHPDDAGVVCSNDSHIRTPVGYNTTVRLVHGTKEGSGRLEIFHENQWGTVCDDSFSSVAATVVCRQLGYPAGIPIPRAHFDSGPGPIWLDNIHCSGYESRIEYCLYDDWGIHDCTHDEDVGVICGDPGEIASEAAQAPALPGASPDVRLIGGPDEHSGRVEIYHNYQWGTVCDYLFGEEEATTTCRMLGYQNAVGFAQFGMGTGSVVVSHLDCPTNAYSWAECSHYPWNHNSCRHLHDIGVTCSKDLLNKTIQTPWRFPHTPPSNVNYPVRLMDFKSGRKGRVEVFIDGKWGTVCDDTFSRNEANVICRMLGYQHGLAIPASAFRMVGSDQPIYLREIRCPPDASSLAECSYKSGINTFCSHIEDIGVRCVDTLHNTVNGPIRLTRGYRPGTGRLELFHNGVWGTVCNDRFKYYEAEVACRTLGYRYGKRWMCLLHGPEFDLPIIVNDFSCSGHEETLFQCQHGRWGEHDCDHNTDVHLFCTNRYEDFRYLFRCY